MRFLPFSAKRDPLVVTPLPFRDLRSQDQLDAEIDREWRQRVKDNEARRAEKRALTYLRQAG